MLDEKISVAAELLSESWRLNQFTRNLAAHITDEKLRKKISNQVARFDKKFLQTTQVFGLEVVDFTGADFETGLPVTPINFADSAEIVKLGGRFKIGSTVSRCKVITNRTLSPRPNAKTKIFTARQKSGGFLFGRVTKFFCNIGTRRTRWINRNVTARNCSPAFKAGSGTDFGFGTIVESAEIICNYTVDDAGSIKLEVEVPAVREEFYGNFYARNDAQVDFNKEAHKINRDGEKLLDRVRNIGRVVDDDITKKSGGRATLQARP